MCLGGVFVVLICGLALAILVAILEFCWNSKKNAQADRQSICSEMAEELRFALRCRGSRQRPALKRNCIKCTPGTTYVPGMSHHLNGVSTTSIVFKKWQKNRFFIFIFRLISMILSMRKSAKENKTRNIFKFHLITMTSTNANNHFIYFWFLNLIRR